MEQDGASQQHSVPDLLVDSVFSAEDHGSGEDMAEQQQQKQSVKLADEGGRQQTEQEVVAVAEGRGQRRRRNVQPFIFSTSLYYT